MQSEPIIVVALGILFIVGNVIYLFLSFCRASDLLDKWASENGYTLIQSSYKSYIPIRGLRPLFYVVVENQDGDQRAGWVECGNSFFGLLSEDVEVTWDN
jgi:hypothetical protein